MMRFIAVSNFASRSRADLLFVPFWEGGESACDEKSLGKEILSLEDFKGKEGETLLYYPKGQKEKRILLLGLGKKKEATLDSLRRSYASAVASLLTKKIFSVNLLLPKVSLSEEEVIQGICEGMLLANYHFTKLKNDSLKDKPLYLIKSVHIIGMKKRDLPIAAKARKLASAVYFVRDLVNQNSDDKPPKYIAELANDLAKKFPSITVSVFDKKRIEKEKMGLLLAVSKSSAVEPRFIILSYKGDPSSKKKIALVGKGVVYDTGGLNIKTLGMETMKADMGGAGTVLGIIAACAMLKVKKNIIAFLPCVENAVGSDSYKPGDVYRSYSGKMVEITNTDAEGRLVLADAISYALENYKPDCLLDYATLTGGVVVALGDEITGYFTPDEKMHKLIKNAAEKTGELAWRLPLHFPYIKLLKSDVADIANSGGRPAHSMQGALFLHAFFGRHKTPWIHFDIAGSAFLSKASGYNPQHATGVAVRLTIAFLEELTDKDY